MPARKSQSGEILLSELLEGIVAVAAGEDRAVCGVAMDSRQVRAGYLFLACRGLTQDGHDFIAIAVAKGAVAVVHEVAQGETSFSFAQVGDVPLLAAANLSQQAELKQYKMLQYYS